MRSRGSILLVVVAALLVVFLMPMREFTIAQALAAGQPVGNTGSQPAPPVKPQVFVANTANRQQVGGTAPHSALASARSADKNKVEIPSRRTASSRTYREAQGYVTEIYPGAINYKAANGDWLPIDNTLVGSRLPGFAYENKGNSYSAYFPSKLGSDPIRFAVPAGWVEFALEGAGGGSGTVTAETATYKNALPGVDVSYTAENQSLKEKLSLASSLSPSSFTYRFRTSPNLIARTNVNRGIDLVDQSGVVEFSFEAPFVYEAANPDGAAGSASLRLAGAANAQTMLLSVDAAWLANPARHWPVVVDPTITYGTVGSAIWKQFNGANQDCYMQNGIGSSTSYCNGSSLYAGYSGGVVSRTLLQFNVQNSIPQDVTVLDADLATYLYQTASGSPVSVDAMQLTQPWTTAATWNTYDGTHAWTTAGGTFATPAAWTDTSVGTASGYYHWYLAQLVQKWVYGTVANDGVLLRTTSESTTNQLSFRSSEYSKSAYWPYLKVTYQLGIGDKPSDQAVSQTLTDRLNLQVDLSSGNLLVKHHEQSVEGTGLNQTVDLFYNNLSPAIWDYGRSWETNTGWDIWLATSHPDGVNYYGPSGTAVHFIKNSDGSFTSPSGVDSTLVRNGDQTYTLTFNQTQEKYNFSSDGLSFLSDTDRNGNQIAFAYNVSGSLASIKDTQGRVTTFSYIAASGCTAPTSDGFVHKMTDPGGRVYQYGYDSNCNLTTITDPANKVTTLGYDANFNLTQITDPVGNVTKLGYDSATRLTSMVRVTNVAQGTGPTTSYSYSTGAGSCAAAPPGDSLYGYTVATDANNHAATLCYDQQGLVLQVIDPSSNSTKNSYTADQQVATSTDALAQTTTNGYNSINDLTSVTPPPLGSGQNPAVASGVFNTPSSVNGYRYLPSSATDPQGHCTAYVFDSAGNATDIYQAQLSPCDGLTGGVHVAHRFQGDPGINCGAKVGALCSSTDGLGNTTTYGYDASGNLTVVTPPSPFGATTEAIDALSRTASVTDGKGQKTSYSYDALDRLTQILYNGATTCTPGTGNCVSYAYDPDGNRTSMTDNTGTTTYYFDPLNRLTTESLPDVGANCPGSNPGGITLAYDTVGNVTSYCDSGGTTTYAYDSSNRPVSLAEPGGNCGQTPSLCTTFAYDANGKRTQTTFPGGATLRIGYDSNDNVTSAVGKDKNGAVISSFAYTYNTGANDTQLKQTATEADAVANNSYTFGYDSLNRLTQANVTAGTGQSYGYGYDANGNMTSRTSGSATTSFAYNAASELCWMYTAPSSNSCSSPPSGATSYTFDLDGNETGNSAGAAFSYNGKNQTTAITGGGTLSPLTYSGTDQNQRTVAGQTTYDNGPGGVRILTTSGTSTFFVRDSTGNLIGERIGSSHYYYLTDAAQSVVGVISGDGLTIANRYGYDPYGNIVSQTETVNNPFKWIGAVYDSATGLYKMGARYYSAALGRFTQVDPAGQGLNPFVYSADDPINNADPGGALWFSWGFNWWYGYYLAVHLTFWDVLLLSWGVDIGLAAGVGYICGVSPWWRWIVGAICSGGFLGYFIPQMLTWWYQYRYGYGFVEYFGIWRWGGNDEWSPYGW